MGMCFYSDQTYLQQRTKTHLRSPIVVFISSFKSISQFLSNFSTILKSASRRWHHLLVDLETLDDAIGLHGGQNDVHQPGTKKQSGGEDFRSLRSAQFPSDLRPSAVHEDGDTDEGKDGEKGDGESKRAGFHTEILALRLVKDSSDRPSHSNAQEDVHGIAARHIADGSIRILILGGCHLTCKSVWNKKKREFGS